MEMYQKTIEIYASTVLLAMRDGLCQNYLKTISSLHLNKHSVRT